MARKTLVLDSFDSEMGVSKAEMYQVIYDYLVSFPSWDVSISEVTFIKDARHYQTFEDYEVYIDQVLVKLLRIDLAGGEDLVVGAIAIHIDWRSLQYVEFVGECGEPAQIIFQLGIDRQVIFSCSTI